MTKSELIKLIYLYTFSAIGLILVIIGSVKILDLGLKEFVFKNADTYYYPDVIYQKTEGISEEQAQKQREEQIKLQQTNIKAERQKVASNSLAMIIVGFPLFFYHWRKILKNNIEKSNIV